MLYATDKEIDMCKIMVKEELELRNLLKYKDKIDMIVEAVLNIIYSKGGDYSSAMIKSVVDTYFNYKMHIKIINN